MMGEELALNFDPRFEKKMVLLAAIMINIYYCIYIHLDNYCLKIIDDWRDIIYILIFSIYYDIDDIA